MELDKILTENPDLSYRDARDLLMEYGADGQTAGELADGRPGTPGM
jgi:hypothetical protein